MATHHCIFQRTAHPSTMVMSGVFPLVGTVTFSPFVKSDFALQIRGLPFVLNMDRGIGLSSYFNTSLMSIGVSLTLLINSNRLRGVHPVLFVKLDFEIAVDQQTKAHDQTFSRGFRTPGTHRCPCGSHALIW